MIVRIDMDRPNGKAYTTNVDEKYYNIIRELLETIRKIDTVRNL